MNYAHGCGHKGHGVERATFAAFPMLALGSLALAWWVCANPPPAWPLPLRWYAAICLAVSCVGLPIGSLRIALRRPPAGISGESRPLCTSNTESAHHDALIGGGSHAWLLRVPGNESLRPIVRDWRVTVPALPTALHGLSILHLTDLHMAPCYGQAFFERVMDRAAALEPDLVLLTGDVVEHADAISWIEPVLARVRGRLGQFAILGNHDHRYGESAVRIALERAGFVDLDGRWQSIRDPVTARVLELGGTSAPWGPELARNTPNPAALRIVLAHTPDVFYRCARWNSADLVLCGHNHGGQIRLPAIGPILMPSRYSRRFDRGFFRSGRMLMYVSQGLGAKHPIRWNCPPEITRLTLQAPARLHAMHRRIERRVAVASEDLSHSHSGTEAGT